MEQRVIGGTHVCSASEVVLWGDRLMIGSLVCPASEHLQLPTYVLFNLTSDPERISKYLKSGEDL